MRAYNAESYQEDKFEKANTDLTQNNLFIGRSFALLTPVMTAVSSGLTLAIYWIGAHLKMLRFQQIQLRLLVPWKIRSISSQTWWFIHLMPCRLLWDS